MLAFDLGVLRHWMISVATTESLDRPGSRPALARGLLMLARGLLIWINSASAAVFIVFTVLIARHIDRASGILALSGFPPGSQRASGGQIAPGFPLRRISEFSGRIAAP